MSCGSVHPVATSSAPTPATAASSDQRAPEVVASCADAAILVENGVARGAICPADAVAKHLTILDLGDTWTPSLFAATPYRATYVALADERDPDGKLLDGEDALQELYGVVPSLAIVRARLADDARHACHAAIDREPIARLDKAFSQDDRDAVKLGEQARVFWEKQVARSLPAIDLAKTLKWAKLDAQHDGIVTAERHFACDGYLREKDVDGSFTCIAGNAVELFQRRNFLMPNERLDAETRDALALDSRELDFRLALRVLRERVIDATGLVEDGTAGAGPQPVLGRMLDPMAMRAARGVQAALPDGAPDLISVATETAAKQLGWLDAASTHAFLETHPARVALALPAPPPYHMAHMDLAAEIDRGDVWYDDQPVPRRVLHRPNLVLYVHDGATKRALVRWPTTIGGWADVRMPDGSVVQRWKESDVGPRVWKDLYAGPTWLAPKTTPDRDLVKNLWNGHWALKKEIFGPGPHAAFGMTLLTHYQVVPQKDGTVRYDDDGIGTHGSASVTSIINGTSHGCHRLYNQLAVRLADFLLHHRTHEVRGDQAEQYRRLVVSDKGSFLAKVDTRGFLYELTPPVPVNVLKGNILSERKYPPRDSAPARP